MPPLLIIDDQDLIVYEEKDQSQSSASLNLQKLEKGKALCFEIGFESPEKAKQALESLSKRLQPHLKSINFLLFEVSGHSISVNLCSSQFPVLEITTRRPSEKRPPPIPVIQTLFRIKMELVLLGGNEFI